jgi:pyruvate dehydrogenase E2 component (dihydrolipoamide acetyltransferase)
MPTLRLPTSIPGLACTRLTLRAWLVQPGAAFAAGTPLAELEAADSIVHLQAREPGTLTSVTASANTTLDLGAAVGEYTASALPAVAATQAAAVPTPPPAPAASPPASPPAPPSPPAATGAVTPLPMPQASNSMEEGTVLKWYVNVGDRVKTGQVLYEIETDKATVDVESPADGRLARIVALPGAVVKVKEPVGYLAESDADLDNVTASASAETARLPAVPMEAVGVGEAKVGAGEGKAAVGAAAVSSESRPAASNGRPKASPAARKVAAELSYPLSAIAAGSGPGGRILSTDVRAAATDVRGAAAKGSAPAAVKATAAGGSSRRPMSKMRRAIATNLQTSKSTVPHFYLRASIEADALLAFARQHKAALGCTVNDVILLAVGRSVAEFPEFRSRADGNDIVELPHANIGVAVSVDDGLVVPVILDVATHTLASLVPEARRIIEASRKGRLENVGKGVFTISNMGMLGVEEFAAIINPPESGILAVAAARESIVVRDGAIKAARVMVVTLSVDHRVVDGALAAKFMASLKSKLENPSTLVGGPQ